LENFIFYVIIFFMNKKKKKKNIIYKGLAKTISFFYGKKKIIGFENIPQDACIIVGNHCQMHGPLLAELKLPFKKYTWCAGQMMKLKDVPAYAFQDFWSLKPKWTHWFYKMLAYLIAPLAVFIFSNADTIGVYKDQRIMSTFKKSIKGLNEGANIIIFPECYTKYNEIVYEFQTNFIALAHLYHKKTGKELSFVPMYNAPKLKTVCFGKPIKYDSTSTIDNQKKEICDYLKNEITSLAKQLPPHTVIPYPNIRKKDYPKSK